MTPSTRIAAILADFPKPVTLYSSGKKWGWLLAVHVLGVGFTVLCFLIARTRSGTTLGEWVAIWGMLTLFVGLGGFSVLMMMPNMSRLQLNEDGFFLIHPLARRRYAWRDVADFSLANIPRTFSYIVVFHHSAVGESGWLAKLKARFYLNSSLGDTFGLKPRDLADLMNEWKRRAEQREAA